MFMQPYDNGPRRRRFAVTVDGVRHEVIVEELDGPPAPGSPSPSPDPAAAESGPSGAENGLGQDGWLSAPMPGTVTEIAVKAGDKVAVGDVLLILTAMKLENEIAAPLPGVVKAVSVAVGDNVNSGDRLVQIEGEEAQP